MTDKRQLAAVIKLNLAVKNASTATGILMGAGLNEIANRAQPGKPTFSDADIAAREDDAVKRERLIQAMGNNAVPVSDSRYVAGTLGGFLGADALGVLAGHLVDHKKHPIGSTAAAFTGVLGGMYLGSKAGMGLSAYLERKRREIYLKNLRKKINALRAARGVELINVN